MPGAFAQIRPYDQAIKNYRQSQAISTTPIKSATSASPQSAAEPELAEVVQFLAGTQQYMQGILSLQQWLENLARLTNSSYAECTRWTEGRPRRSESEIYGSAQPFETGWIHWAERIMQYTANIRPTFLDQTGVAEHTPIPLRNNVSANDTILVALDWIPARIVLILGKTDAEPDWNARTRKLIELLMPHMSASVELHKNMDRVQQLANTTSNILDSAPRGIVALSNRQQIWYSNASAESTLADNDGVTHNKHMLKFADSTIQAEFLNQLDLLETMPAEQLADVKWDILVPRSSGRPAYQMMMRAMALLDWNTESTRGGRIALIYLNDSSQNMQPTFEQIKNFHGLTSAEAKIAAILYNGVSPADAATELGISIHTVRSHLRNIFSKVGVRNQPELISKLVSTLKHREA